MRWLLSVRARSACSALAMFGFALLSPGGLRGSDVFLKTPLGPTLACLGLIMLGISVEETGTIRRIRAGAAIRLAGFTCLAGAAVWAAILRANDSKSGSGFGWFLVAVGTAGVGYAARADLAVYKDPRSGQPLRLEDISGSALHITVEGGDTLAIPTSEIIGAVGFVNGQERGIFITVKRKLRLGEAALHRLPWIASGRDGDTFALTEHQAGMDAQTLVTKVTEAAGAGLEGGYR